MCKAHLLFIGCLVLLTACGNGSSSAVPGIKHDTLATKKDSSADNDTAYHGFVHADEYFTKPTINLPADLAVFVPKGYTALDTISGDLNLDSIPDKILILRKAHEDTIDQDDTAGRRPLLILTGQADHSFKLAAQNDKVVLCYHCGGAGGDAYQETVIKNGYFSVEYGGNTPHVWSRIVTFRYSAADSSWYLHKDGRSGEGTHKSSIRTEKDFGKMPIGQFDVYSSF